MRIFRSYPDRTASEVPNDFGAIFGKATDTDTTHALFVQQSVIGFADGGKLAIPFTIPAGQRPVDIRITNGASGAPGGGNFVRCAFSKDPVDLSKQEFLPPGAPSAAMRVGNVKGQQHAAPEAHPGEAWTLYAEPEHPGPFWLVLNCTAH